MKKDSTNTLIIISFLVLFPWKNVIAQDIALQDQVSIRRTEYGVPHITADNLKAVAFGLAYAEIEDRGEKVILPLIKARGEFSRFTGMENIDSDFHAKLSHELTRETYHTLDQDTRDILSGFAEGINYYLSVHGEKFPDWYQGNFNGIDVAAVSNGMSIPTTRNARDFLRYLEETKKRQMENADVGSNVWAFSPERTKSGNSILMRNPHLSWEAGYYEAHITVPGKVNFYGDFRIGGIFSIICGFNDHLGWSTTNNHPDLEEVYALPVDPDKPDHYLLDEGSFPISRKLIEVEFKNGDGTGIEKKEWLYTPFGPVIHRENGFIYVVKAAGWRNFQRGEQLVAMMKSKNLEEWRTAMSKRYITSSNYTYADGDGNIFYIWNASTPKLPHSFGGDTTAHIVSQSSEIWNEYLEFQRVPQIKNPKGGYLQNSNDPFYFTNLNEIIPLDGQPANFPEPLLRWRSQHSLSLVGGNEKFTLEDVVEMKYSMKMMAADRMKEDLINIIKDHSTDTELLKAADYLASWDNTSSAESLGSVLFNEWFWQYRDMMDNEDMYAEKWTPDKPIETPYGISLPDSAFKAFQMAIDTVTENHGSWEIAWGDVYRVRRGAVDVPVGGGSGTLGNFRVLYFNDDEDGKKSVAGGDGWVFVVEFGKKIKAYSILAYGQSNDPENPHFDDQAQMFAENKMKSVAFSEKEIRKALIKSYAPGEE